MKLTTCGNSCDACKAYKGNIAKLDEREALSAAWKKYLGFEYCAEDVRCEGGSCCSVGLGFVHQGCKYKECASAHGVEHCGQCPEYPCAKSDDGRNIDERHMREKFREEFNIDEYERYVKVFDNQTWLGEYKQQEPEYLTMCGYRCDLCKAFTDNIKKNDEREALSRMWEKYYGLHIPADEIYCDGCRNMRPDAKRVDMGCAVRVCVMEKGIAHCGQCGDYPCEKFMGRRGLSIERAKAEQGGQFDLGEFNSFILAFDNETRLNTLKAACNGCTMKD